MDTGKPSKDSRRGRPTPKILSPFASATPTRLSSMPLSRLPLWLRGSGHSPSSPLTTRGGLVGKFMAYYPTAHMFTDEEITIAVTIARQFAFGLERMRAEDEQNRFVIEGTSVWVSANTSLNFTLCLHEVATNAVKYGALSNRSGHVRVSWELCVEPDQRRLCLTWQEKGGPPVKLPDRKGFGSLLIELTREGQTSVDFRPDGVSCLLELPL